MYKEIQDYVKTCEDCQEMTRIPIYYFGLGAPLTSLFDVVPIDFAGTLPTTPRVNKHLLFCVEHLTGWPIICPTPTTTAAEVIAFVEEQVIMPFERPRVIVSDNSPCFTAGSLENFMEQNNIKVKTVLVYAPMSNLRAERMVGTIKRGIRKMVHSRPHDWDLVISKVSYVYRRQNLAYGFSPYYELMYGIVPRMPLEYSPVADVEDPTAKNRKVETLALAIYRAIHMNIVNGRPSRSVVTKSFKAGDFILVARGKALGSNIKWPPFSSKFYGPCMISSPNHPHYKLTSAHNRHTRKAIHARRLVVYNTRTFHDITTV